MSESEVDTIMGKVYGTLSGGGGQSEVDKVMSAVYPDSGSPAKTKDFPTAALDTAKEIGGNILPSAGRAIRNLAQPLIHPISTIQGIGEMAGGAVQAGVREATGGKSISGKEVPMSRGEQVFRSIIVNPIVEAVKDPKQALKKLGQYAVDSPVEFAQNFSGGLGLLGKFTGVSMLARFSEYINPLSLVTKPVAKGAEKLAKKLTPTGMTSEMIERQNIGSKVGAPLTPADITESKAHAIFEKQLKENIGSAKKADVAQEAKAQAVQNYATKLLKDMGGDMDKLSAGQITQDSANKFYHAFMNKAAKLYGQVPISDNEMLSTKALSITAAEHADDLGKINTGTIKRILSTVEGPEGYRPEPYLWKELIADQQTLRKMARNTSDYNKKRVYNSLINAINDDISSFSRSTPNTQVKQALDAAVNFYREGDASLPGIKTFRDRQISQVLSTTSPEDIVNKFVKASNNVSDLKRLREVSGPKGWNAIKRAWLQDMIERGEDKSFNPGRFRTAYDNYKRGGNLGILLNRTEREGLDRLYDISSIINTAEKIAGNPSGTGRMYMNAAAHWVSHPIVMTVTQIGANKMADLYFSNPAFQRFLIEGLGASSNSVKAINAAAQMAKIASQSGAINIGYQIGQLSAAAQQ